jgi:hypothetical protein
VLQYGNIYSDEGKTNYEEGGSIQPLTDYFDKFTFDDSHFIGRKSNGPFDSGSAKVVEEYFIFSLINGTKENIKGFANLSKKLKEIRFHGDTAFMTIKEYAIRL